MILYLRKNYSTLYVLIFLLPLFSNCTKEKTAPPQLNYVTVKGVLTFNGRFVSADIALIRKESSWDKVLRSDFCNLKGEFYFDDVLLEQEGVNNFVEDIRAYYTIYTNANPYGEHKTIKSVKFNGQVYSPETTTDIFKVEQEVYDLEIVID